MTKKMKELNKYLKFVDGNIDFDFSSPLPEVDIDRVTIDDGSIKVMFCAYDSITEDKRSNWLYNDFVKRYLKFGTYCFFSNNQTILNSFYKPARITSLVRGDSMKYDNRHKFFRFRTGTIESNFKPNRQEVNPDSHLGTKSEIYSKEFQIDSSSNSIDKVHYETTHELKDMMSVDRISYFSLFRQYNYGNRRISKFPDNYFQVDQRGQYNLENIFVIAYAYLDTDQIIKDFNLPAQFVTANSKPVRWKRAKIWKNGRISSFGTQNVGNIIQQSSWIIDNRTMKKIDSNIANMSHKLVSKLINTSKKTRDEIISLKNRSYFSDLFLTKDQNGEVRFAFAFEKDRFIQDHTSHGRIYDLANYNVKTVLQSKIKISKIRMTRFQTKKKERVTRLNSKIIKNERLIGDQVDEQVFLGKEINGLISFTDPDTKQVPIHAGPFSGTGISFFTGIDREISRLSDGDYSYKIEVELEDTTPEYFKELTNNLSKSRSDLMEYKNYCSKHYPITKILEIEERTGKNVMGSINRGLSSNYNPFEDRFTFSFARRANQKYVDKKPWINPVTELVTAMSSLGLLDESSTSETSVNKEGVVRYFYNITNPITGTPGGVDKLINQFDKTIKTLEKYITNTSNNQRMFKNPKKKSTMSRKERSSLKRTTRIEKRFDNSISAKSSPMGVSYLLGQKQELNAENVGLVTLDRQEVNARVEDEIRKAFKNKSTDTDILKQVETKTVDLDNLLGQVDVFNESVEEKLNSNDFSLSDHQNSNIVSESKTEGDSSYTTAYSYLSPSKFLVDGEEYDIDQVPSFMKNKIVFSDLSYVSNSDNSHSERMISNVFNEFGISINSIGNSMDGQINPKNLKDTHDMCSTFADALFSTTKDSTEAVVNFNLKQQDEITQRKIIFADQREPVFQHVDSESQQIVSSPFSAAVYKKLPNLLKSLYLTGIQSDSVSGNQKRSAFLGNLIKNYHSGTPAAKSSAALKYEIVVRNMMRIEYLAGFEKEFDLGSALGSPIFAPLEGSILNQMNNKVLLCRLSPYENKEISLTRSQVMEKLHVYNEYFLIDLRPSNSGFFASVVNQNQQFTTSFEGEETLVMYTDYAGPTSEQIADFLAGRQEEREEIREDIENQEKLQASVVEQIELAEKRYESIKGSLPRIEENNEIVMVIYDQESPSSSGGMFGALQSRARADLILGEYIKTRREQIGTMRLTANNNEKTALNYLNEIRPYIGRGIDLSQSEQRDTSADLGQQDILFVRNKVQSIVDLKTETTNGADSIEKSVDNLTKEIVAEYDRILADRREEQRVTIQEGIRDDINRAEDDIREKIKNINAFLNMIGSNRQVVEQHVLGNNHVTSQMRQIRSDITSLHSQSQQIKAGVQTILQELDSLSNTDLGTNIESTTATSIIQESQSTVLEHHTTIQTNMTSAQDKRVEFFALFETWQKENPTDDPKSDPAPEPEPTPVTTTVVTPLITVTDPDPEPVQTGSLVELVTDPVTTPETTTPDSVKPGASGTGTRDSNNLVTTQVQTNVDIDTNTNTGGLGSGGFSRW